MPGLGTKVSLTVNSLWSPVVFETASVNLTNPNPGTGTMMGPRSVPRGMLVKSSEKALADPTSEVVPGNGASEMLI